MAIYSLCGFNIEIKNKYRYTRYLCADYKAEEGAVPDFSVEVSLEDIEKGKDIFPGCGRGYIEGSLLYNEICNKLSDRGGFMFHSSVVSLDGEGYVFTAKSGTGKTTHSRLWLENFPGSYIVNGDKPIIRLEEDGFYAYGTPWCGKESYNKNDKVKIKAVCFLSQAKENKIRVMKNAEVVREVFEQLLRPDSVEGLDKVLRILDKFILSTPFYHLDCTISKEAAELSYKTMKGQEK